MQGPAYSSQSNFQTCIKVASGCGSEDMKGHVCYLNQGAVIVIIVILHIHGMLFKAIGMDQDQQVGGINPFYFPNSPTAVGKHFIIDQLTLQKQNASGLIKT